MATSTIKIANRESRETTVPVKKNVRKKEKVSLQEVNESQLQSLAQGIKEAFFISL
jgi:hypothetical protein